MTEIVSNQIPYNPKTGHQAKVNEPETWGSFNQSLKGLQKFKASGIGVMIRKGLIGIDLDNAVDHEGKAKSEAQKIISRIPNLLGIFSFWKKISWLCVRITYPRTQDKEKTGGWKQSGSLFF